MSKTPAQSQHDDSNYGRQNRNRLLGALSRWLAMYDEVGPAVDYNQSDYFLQLKR